MSDDKKPVLAVVSKVKAYVKDRHGLSLGKDALDELNLKIGDILDGAADSAKSDKRKTIKCRDV